MSFKWWAVGLVSSGIILIVAFGWWYGKHPTEFSLHGELISNEQVEDETVKKLDFMYFSVVTWCGLGYGDFTPNSRPMRVLAALEAFLGIVAFGILVAAAALSKQKPRSDPAT